MIKEILQGRGMGHPLHPMFVHLPVGLWAASLIFDIAHLSTGNAALASASYYCILLGLVGVLFAAPAGFADYQDIASNSRPKRIALTHMMMNIGISVLYLINLLSRRAMEDGVPTLVSRGQFFLSLVSLILLGISGYLGGVLVYQYGVGHRAAKHPPREERETRREVA